MKLKKIKGIRLKPSSEPKQEKLFKPTIGIATILLGDVLEVLKAKPENSFDAIYCDPPYGISFMGKEWDHGVPSAEVWKEILRVLKPGGYLLAFGGTRTYHRLAVNIEDAGFEIRDQLMWLHGSGFPKGVDISKAIDKSAGEELEVIRVENKSGIFSGEKDSSGSHAWTGKITSGNPVTTDAQRWEGYKTALKPAFEPIVVAMKPLDGTYVENALKHGVAGFNIDGARIGGFTNTTPSGYDRVTKWRANNRDGKEIQVEDKPSDTPSGKSGRFPANLVLSHTVDCVQDGVKKVNGTCEDLSLVLKAGLKRLSPVIDRTNADGTETVENWVCSEECPIRMLDEQTGVLTSGAGSIRNRSSKENNGNTGRAAGTEMVSYGDKGGASRFFYNAKASKSEREAGLEPVFDEDGKQKRANPHPTVKPIDLNRYFTHLILPPKRDNETRKLLVPFSGVGSEVIGALLGGWDHVIGIEIDPEYARISRERIYHWRNKGV